MLNHFGNRLILLDIYVPGTYIAIYTFRYFRSLFSFVAGTYRKVVQIN